MSSTAEMQRYSMFHTDFDVDIHDRITFDTGEGGLVYQLKLNEQDQPIGAVEPSPVLSDIPALLDAARTDPVANNALHTALSRPSILTLGASTRDFPE